MPKNIKIRILDQDGSNEEIVELVFEDKDWEVIEDFVRYAAELQTSALVEEGIPAKFSFNWTEGEGFKVETDLPDKEKIDSLLLELRPFVLLDEPTHVNKVRNIVAKATDNRRVRKYLDTLSYLFSGKRLQSMFVAGASTPEYPEGVIINSEDMLQVWLNGYRFHRNKDHQKLFAAMHGIMPIDSSIALFLFMISDKVLAILSLERMLALLSGRHETIYVDMILEEPIRYYAFLHASAENFSFLELDEESRPLPEEGFPFVKRVFDLTKLGPAHLDQFIDLVGKLWMHGELAHEIGEHHYLFRVGKFTTPDGKVAHHGMDIYARIKATVFLLEDPLSADRRKPVKATLERMQAERKGEKSSRVFLRHVETKDELDKILDQDPKPHVEFVVVPRIAFRFAYWPLSKEARDKAKRIMREEKREPTFEEIEGTNILRAWQIFEEEDSSES